jgi:6-phosphogluconolactonase
MMNDAQHVWILYVGTYTGTESKGIYAYRFDTATGKLTSLGLAGETSNPSFLAVHPNHQFLYTVNENPAGMVTAFAIDDKSAGLELLNSVSSKGEGPCHLSFDRTGQWLFVANYDNGSVAALAVQAEGTLGEASSFVQHSGSSVDRQRQRGPHAHSVDISPDNRFLLVNDLGLDQVLVYRFDSEKGRLTSNTPAAAALVSPGSGPRHLSFNSNGNAVYVFNEINATVTVFSYDNESGKMAEAQTISALPADFSGVKSGAEIAVHPNGRFLYVSNRGHDSIATFTVDSESGALNHPTWTPTQGKNPRNFAIDPSGSCLLAANQSSDNVVVFRIDPNSGHLSPLGDPIHVLTPVSLVFVPIRG